MIRLFDDMVRIQYIVILSKILFIMLNRIIVSYKFCLVQKKYIFLYEGRISVAVEYIRFFATKKFIYSPTISVTDGWKISLNLMQKTIQTTRWLLVQYDDGTRVRRRDHTKDLIAPFMLFQAHKIHWGSVL